MDTKKIILLNAAIFGAVINTLYLYLQSNTIGEGFKTFAYQMYMPIITIFILFIIGTLAIISITTSITIAKKNTLRIALIITAVMFLISIITRIMEILAGIYCISCWISTILYFIIGLILIFMLKELYDILKKLFKYRKV